MNSTRYLLVDVFTRRLFGGNQLAVFVDGHEVPDELMQPIAREMNLSETTFVLPPVDPGNTLRLRIFTPLEELPMAGHPTVGTAFALAVEGRLPAGDGLRFEEGVGPIPVELELTGGRPSGAFMDQPLPEFGPVLEDRPAVARMLGLEPEELAPDLPLEVVSCGVPFLYVPLASLAAVRRASLRIDLWRRLLDGFASRHVYLFSRETVSSEASVHARMFAPAAGVPEDPATGSASGPLGCYLVRHGLAGEGGPARVRCEQGLEIGRPSLIDVEVWQQGDGFSRVRVGGGCVLAGEGSLRLG